MQEQQESMSLMKKLTRISKEGGSMSAEERFWFEKTNRESQKLAAQVKASAKTK